MNDIFKYMDNGLKIHPTYSNLLYTFNPVSQLECIDSLPPDYGKFETGVGCSNWTCVDWADFDTCNNDWSIYTNCTPTSSGLIKDYCRKSCDNCGALHITTDLNVFVSKNRICLQNLST